MLNGENAGRALEKGTGDSSTESNGSPSCQKKRLSTFDADPESLEHDCPLIQKKKKRRRKEMQPPSDVCFDVIAWESTQKRSKRTRVSNQRRSMSRLADIQLVAADTSATVPPPAPRRPQTSPYGDVTPRRRRSSGATAFSTPDSDRRKGLRSSPNSKEKSEQVFLQDVKGTPKPPIPPATNPSAGPPEKRARSTRGAGLR